MKVRNRITSLLLCALVLAGSANAAVLAAEGDAAKDTAGVSEELKSVSFITRIEEDKLYITGFTFTGDKAPETVTFPGKIDGKTVYGIQNFKDIDGDVSFGEPVELHGIKKLVVGDGIQVLGGVFSGMDNLEEVELPQSVERIASLVFSGAPKFRHINLDNVKIIASAAFRGCTELDAVNLGSAEKIGKMAFDGNKYLAIIGKKDSAAEKYASENGLKFVNLEVIPTEENFIETDGVKYFGIEKTAYALSKLGLMKGVGKDESGKIDFGTGRVPTRAEAVTMLVRILGGEKDAAALGKTHPFTDVPSWADGYVSYAYERGLTKGVSETLFGSDRETTRTMYLTFLLRALGYDDSGKSQEELLELGAALGITHTEVDIEKFLRSEMIDMSYNALLTRMNGEKGTKLFEKMIADGTFTREAWDEIYFFA